MKRTLLLPLFLASFGIALAGDLPDPGMTPGAVDPSINQDNIQQTVCVRGYTKTVRPPAYYTNDLKKRQIREYGYPDRNPKHYEEDHLIPLSLGGNPRDERNLWPEPRNGEWNAGRKDQLEFVLYRMVCRGEIGLLEAQQAISSNWINAWTRYVPSHQKYKFHKID